MPEVLITVILMLGKVIPAALDGLYILNEFHLS
jgi:hypothetical protein